MLKAADIERFKSVVEKVVVSWINMEIYSFCIARLQKYITRVELESK